MSQKYMDISISCQNTFFICTLGPLVSLIILVFVYVSGWNKLL